MIVEQISMDCLQILNKCFSSSVHCSVREQSLPCSSDREKEKKNREEMSSEDQEMSSTGSVCYNVTRQNSTKIKAVNPSKPVAVPVAIGNPKY